jgi:hypothetical protein
MHAYAGFRTFTHVRTRWHERPALLGGPDRQQICDQRPLGIGKHLKTRHDTSVGHEHQNLCGTRNSYGTPTLLPLAMLLTLATATVAQSHRIDAHRHGRMPGRSR